MPWESEARAASVFSTASFFPKAHPCPSHGPLRGREGHESDCHLVEFSLDCEVDETVPLEGRSVANYDRWVCPPRHGEHFIDWGPQYPLRLAAQEGNLCLAGVDFPTLEQCHVPRFTWARKWPVGGCFIPQGWVRFLRSSPLLTSVGGRRQADGPGLRESQDQGISR